MGKDQKNKESKKEPKRNHKRSAIIAVLGFSAFAIHVYLTKGSSEFIWKFLHGDPIYIANLVMTMFVITGWFLVYKYLGKLL